MEMASSAASCGRNAAKPMLNPEGVLYLQREREEK